MIELPICIDSTMIGCSRSCQQKFLLEFVQGYRPPGLSIDLHAGACFATALEETYRGLHDLNLDLDAALVRSHAAFAQAWGNFEIPEYKRTAKTFDRVWEAVEEYFIQYAPKTDPVQPYRAADGKATYEYTFAIPLEPTEEADYHKLPEIYNTSRAFPLHPSGSPFLYSGRFDMLGTYFGRPIVKDDKTTGSSIGQNWAEQWDLRSQFLGYVWACQQCGIPVESVCVRGIAIQKTQIVHAEAIKTYSKFLIERWHEQLRRDLWRIRRAYDEGYFDFNLGDACTQYGHCSFMGVCQSPNPESWLSNYEVRKWNPLNKNPVQPIVEATPEPAVQASS